MFTHLLRALCAVLLVGAATAHPGYGRECSGSAKYSVTFNNFLTARRFGSLIPKDGLVYSPLTGASHSGRVSILTVRGYASEAIEAIAETGNNTLLVNAATELRDANQGVKTATAAMGPTMPGNSTTLEFMVDCEHSYISVVGMIAPSPDWIVLLANVNLVRGGHFIYKRRGALIAYDGGSDSGREFTDPADPSLDIPTSPKLNIAPLVEDETDRFEGRVVGSYTIRKLY